MVDIERFGIRLAAQRAGIEYIKSQAGYGDMWLEVWNDPRRHKRTRSGTIRIREPVMGGGRQLYKSFDALRNLDQAIIKDSTLPLPLRFKAPPRPEIHCPLFRECDDEPGSHLRMTWPSPGILLLRVREVKYGQPMPAAAIEIRYADVPQLYLTFNTYARALLKDYKNHRHGPYLKRPTQRTLLKPRVGS